MNKKMISFILLLAIIASVFAAGVVSATEYNYIVDEMGFIPQSEIEQLNSKAAAISEQTGIDVVFKLSENSLEGSDLISYAENTENLGSGSDNCLVLAVGQEWYVHYTGTVTDFMTDEYEQALFDAYDEESSYESGARKFFEKAEEIIYANVEIDTTPETTEPHEDGRPRLVDLAGLLTREEFNSLIDRLNRVSESKKFDIVICTVDSTDGKRVADFADDMFDYDGYGYGIDRDGVLLLISMEERDWYISTRGFGITAFSSSGIQYTGNEIKGYLGNGEYLAAFNKFVDICEEFVDNARNGDIDNNGTTESGSRPFPVLLIPISLLAGFVIALIVVGVMKSQLKSVRSQAAANCYVVPESMVVTDNLDLFLYSNVTRTEKPKNNDGGGSHTSSSGAEHGGGGGKF